MFFKKKKVVMCMIGLLLIVGSIIAIKELSRTKEPSVKEMYEKTFGKRYYTYKPSSYKFEYFENLKEKKHEFTSDKGQKLIGYRFYRDDMEAKGTIITAHGMDGGGFNFALPIINYFVENGFYVFAFDMTGNDASEGKCVEGFPQGVIDLEHAINYVKSQEEFENLPICLYGHSWGGYSVANVLNECPDIKAVAALAGFNESYSMIETEGRAPLKGKVDPLEKEFRQYEKEKFGKYATQTAMEGFEKSDAKVMIVHSKDDKEVKTSMGYDIYYEKYKDDPRFIFKLYDGEGHGGYRFDKEKIQYRYDMSEKYEEYVKEQKEKGIEVSDDMGLEWYSENIDKYKFTHVINYDLFDEMIEMFESAL